MKKKVLQNEERFITYYPWSEEVLNECINDYLQGKLPTIDLDLTARCTKCSCIYCDSIPSVGKKNPLELTLSETIQFLKEAKEFGAKWIYVCGLGEPFEDTRFFDIVAYSRKLDINFSVFTNAQFITKEVAKLLHEHNVFLIIKLDTFDEQTFDRILGGKGRAKRIYQAIEYLLEVGYTQNNKNKSTDLAFSIVPTRLNLSTIPDVIAFAKEHNIFPSIGELEFSGRAKIPSIYEELRLSYNEIKHLKNVVEEMLWPDYKRPICPAILTGIHINNIGDCVVDKATGLVCKWFLLREPRIKIIGNIRRCDLLTLFNRVKKYRQECFTHREIIHKHEIDYIFGGCGGNPRDVIKIAKDIVDKESKISLAITS
jgi:MoaA/NifB/PqqE/SkfB family radical SAM enzyme